jgi:hypothetical protein
MGTVQAKIAVFYVDDRPCGWYWTEARDDMDDLLKGPITGPFETEADAIEHAVRSGTGRLH